MKVEIKNKKENKLLHRTEVTGSITFDKATPNRTDVRNEVAGQLKVSADVLVMKRIIGAFGGGSAEFEAVAYESGEHLKRIETAKGQKQVEKKEEPKEEAAAPAEEKKEAAEKPAEAQAEKPAEEKKKEAPAEEKPAEEKKVEAE